MCHYVNNLSELFAMISDTSSKPLFASSNHVEQGILDNKCISSLYKNCIDIR